MSLRSKKRPVDLAPDWVDHTYLGRLSNCIMLLHLFDVVDNAEAMRLYQELNKWKVEYESLNEE